MKTINTLRYTGSNNVTIIADKKNNPSLLSTIQATALSADEAEKQLEADLSLQIEDEFTIAITDFDPKKFTSRTTDQLLKLYEKTEQMLGAHEMIEAILIKRGAIQVNEDPSDPVEEDPTSEEEETKPAREYKKCMTEECLQARLAEARTNYKKFARFLCTKTKTEEVGLVRSARLDKRSGFIQYRIEIISLNEDGTYTLTGRVFGKGDDSKDLTLLPADSFKPAPKAEPAQETEEPAQEA